MDMRYFKFDSKNHFSEASLFLKKQYPDFAVLEKPTELILAVESKNSTALDDQRIAPLLRKMGGELID